MSENSSNRDRRDWTLIIFLLPIGILLMVLAGQFAIRLVPFWSVDGGMGSNLDPESASGQDNGLIPAISFDILTPMGWLENFLTPGPGSASDGLAFAPFVVFEPSSTPSATSTVTGTSTSVTATSTPSGTSTSTSTATSTKKPGGGGSGTPPPPTTCTDPLATNNGGPLPCTYPPPTCNDANATNNGGPAPCTYPVPVTSTLVGTATAVPGNTNPGAPDGAVGNVTDGNYVVIDLSSSPIIVNGISDTSYDLAYYEMHVAPCGPAGPCPSGSGIQMDSVILSISVLNSGPYYVVFNWGDGAPDTNSNIGDVASSTGTEDDNQSIDSSELAGSGATQTGVQVDVDNAASHPPPGNYSYLAIQAPDAPAGDGNDGADVDSVEVLP